MVKDTSASSRVSSAAGGFGRLNINLGLSEVHGESGRITFGRANLEDDVLAPYIAAFAQARAYRFDAFAIARKGLST